MAASTMSRQWFGVLGAALPLLLIPAVAGADTLEGSIDGEERQWYILEADGRSTAEFSEHMPGMLGISVQGHAEESFAMRGTIAVSITLIDGEPVGGLEVSYFPEDGMFPMYTSAGESDWNLDPVEEDGDTAAVSGHFTGTLQRVESMRDEPDPDDTLAVELRFDVTAIRGE